MAVVNELVRSGVVDQDVNDLLNWMLKQGADPRKVAIIAKGSSGGWGNNTEEFPTVSRVPHQGRSAITLTLGLLKTLERINVYDHKGKYEEQLAAAKRLLHVFGKARVSLDIETTTVTQVREMWSNIQLDRESADVELHVKGEDDCDESNPPAVIFAHSTVLKHASPVLGASLFGAMREGRSRILPVFGATRCAVEWLLSIAYTGSRPEDMRFNCNNFSRPTQRLAVGDHVEVNWQQMGWWYTGRLVKRDSQGFFDVSYDVGGYFEREVLPCDIKLVSRPPPEGREAASETREGESIDLVTLNLMCLDLAHRWQMAHAVALIESALSNAMKDFVPAHSSQARHARDVDRFVFSTGQRELELELLRNFEAMFDAALLKNLPALRTSCRQYALECEQVRDKHERGEYGQRVTQELQTVFN